MTLPRVLSPEQRALIAKQYGQQGHSLRAVARMHNVSVTTVMRVLDAEEVPVRKMGHAYRNDDVSEEAGRLHYEHCMTLSSIGDRLKLNAKYVSKLLVKYRERHGIPARRPSHDPRYDSQGRIRPTDGQ